MMSVEITLAPPLSKIPSFEACRDECWYRIRYYQAVLERARKITVEIQPELLDKAQRASGVGITQTVRTGLQLVAASQTYSQLLGLRGKIRFTRTSADLKVHRESQLTRVRGLRFF